MRVRFDGKDIDVTLYPISGAAVEMAIKLPDGRIVGLAVKRNDFVKALDDLQRATPLHVMTAGEMNNVIDTLTLANAGKAINVPISPSVTIAAEQRARTRCVTYKDITSLAAECFGAASVEFKPSQRKIIVEVSNAYSYKYERMRRFRELLPAGFTAEFVDASNVK